MEKSYVEIKVSFIHVMVLLAGVILIGTFLFYLGYQAGKSSARAELQASGGPNSPDPSEELKLSDDSNKSQDKGKEKDDSISDEIRLHQLPTTTTTTTTTTSAQPEPKKQRLIEEAKPVKKEPYFAVQVGAFADHSNAQKYSIKFANMGYPTEINTSEKNNKKFFRVWVGNFKTRAEAQKERDKLAKSEKGKFSIVSSE